MQIHDLNTKTLTNPAYVAFDDGTDTYKADFKAEIDNAAASAVADADLTDNTVAFTSGDAESPTTWTAVSVLTSGLTIKVLFNRISTMIKNVRYIWNLLGSSSFSNVASTLTGAIGNTALPTTAQTLSGAIAEHESDISTLNSKLTYSTGTFAKANSNIGTAERTIYTKVGRIVVVDLTFNVDTTITESTATLFNGLPPAERTTRFRLPHGYNASMPTLVLCVTTTGTIANQWSYGGVQTGQWAGQFAYIAQD